MIRLLLGLLSLICDGCVLNVSIGNASSSISTSTSDFKPVGEVTLPLKWVNKSQSISVVYTVEHGNQRIKKTGKLKKDIKEVIFDWDGDGKKDIVQMISFVPNE